MDKKTYIAFDIDGTIYDATSIVIEAFETGIKNFIKKNNSHIKIPAYDEIMKVVGIPVDEIFRILFPGLNRRELIDINNECTRCFETIIRDGGGKIFDNVFETIEKLYNSGYIMLAASNGRLEYVKSILETFDLIKFFQKPIMCPGGNIIDKTDLVRYYVKNVTKGNLIVMVGDRFTDREAAEMNKIPFVGCAFGHAGLDEISGSRWIVNKFEDIPGIILNIEEDMN